MSSVDSGAYRGWLRRPTLLWANTFYLAAAAGLIVLSVVARMLALVFPAVSASVFTYLSTAVFELGFLLWPALHFAADRPGAGAAMRLTPPCAPAVVLAVISAVVGVFLSDALGTLWLLLIERLGGSIASSAIVPADGPAGRIAQFLLVGVLPGICEETAFRGALLGAWERRGTRYAIVVTALLFAALHGNIQGFPIQLMIGLALGYIVVATGSLYTGMIYHATHNALLMMMAGVSTSMVEMTRMGHSLFETVGGSGGVWLTALNTLMLGVIYVALLAAYRFINPSNRLPVRSPARCDQTPMDVQTLIVLVCAVATTIIMLILDLLRMMGVV